MFWFIDRVMMSARKRNVPDIAYTVGVLPRDNAKHLYV